MKFTLSIAAASLAAMIYALCPGPNVPECAKGTPMNGTVTWPCCEQTMACPADGTKWARTVYQFPASINGQGQLVCMSAIGAAWLSLDTCCGDPWPE